MAALLLYLTITAPPTPRDGLARLDLTRPGLEAVRAAFEADDLTTAAAALRDYYRARPMPAVVGDGVRPAPNPAYDTSAADALLRREVSFVGKPATLTHDIDWTSDPHRDIEWPIELNRHFFWRPIIEAWWHTGDDRYLDDVLFMLEDWIDDNPMPDRDGRGAWRTLECGLRLQSAWPIVFWHAVRSDRFAPALIGRMLASMAEQCDWLMRYPKGGNWLLMERTGILTVAACFPEFADAAEWRSAAWATMAREMTAQVYPDGAQMELTPHYNRVCVDNFTRAADIARGAGLEVPGDYLGALERMYEYVLLLVKPDGYIPMLNDSDHDNERSLLARGAAMFEREDMRYVATGGAVGTPPAQTSYAFPWAGQYLLRSGWSLDDVYLCLDAGPYGTGHQHEDKLSLDVWGYGDELIVDPGRYTYVGGAWRSYFVSTASHSTVLVDGAGQRRRQVRSSYVNREPQPNRLVVTPAAELVCGSYEEGYGNGADVIHVRKAVFMRDGGYFVVIDDLLPRGTAADEVTMTVQFQLAHAGATLDPDTLAVRGGGERGSVLIQPVTRAGVEATLHEGEEDPPAGWVGWSLHQALKLPATMVRYSLRGTPPLRFVTVLRPHRTGEEPDLPDGLPANNLWDLPDPAPGAPLVDVKGGPIVCRSAGPESRLRWGYAAGGGLIFERGPEPDGSFRLAGTLFDVPYQYAVVHGERTLQSGTYMLPAPKTYDFEDGETAGWSGEIARPGAGGSAACLHAASPATTEPAYVTLSQPRRLVSDADLYVALDWRSPVADGGDWYYVKVTLVDEEGRYWSSYVARAPSDEWRQVELRLGDFRGDTAGSAIQGQSLPAGVRFREVQVVGRKGVTGDAVAMVLQVDQVAISGTPG